MAGGRRRGGSERQRHGVVGKTCRDHELRQAEASEMNHSNPRVTPQGRAILGVTGWRLAKRGPASCKRCGEAWGEPISKPGPSGGHGQKKSCCFGSMVEVGRISRTVGSLSPTQHVKRSHVGARCRCPGLLVWSEAAGLRTSGRRRACGEPEGDVSAWVLY